MSTALVVGVAIVVALVALVVGLVAVFDRRARRIRALIALGLAAASAVFGLWGLGLIFRTDAPVPESDLLYGTTSDTIYALAARDATTRWRVSFAPAQNSGFPVAQDGVVYVSTNLGVRAFRASDGHRLWQSTTAIQVEPGSIANGVLYGASLQNGQPPQLAALDVADGHLLWQAPGPFLASNLLPLGSIVLVGDDQGRVRALDATSGATLWQSAVQGAGPVLWLTAGGDGTVYGITQQFGTLHPALAFALGPQTHALRWQHLFSPTTFLLPVLTAIGGDLYVGTDTSLVALEAASGSQRWQHPHPNDAGGASQVAVDQGIVYFGNIGGFYALHAADGTPVWTHGDSTTLAFGPPLLSNGVVFSQTVPAGPTPFFTFDSGRHVYAFRASDGYQYYRH